jgi:hypothetical protein
MLLLCFVLRTGLKRYVCMCSVPKRQCQSNTHTHTHARTHTHTHTHSNARTHARTRICRLYMRHLWRGAVNAQAQRICSSWQEALLALGCACIALSSSRHKILHCYEVTHLEEISWQSPCTFGQHIPASDPCSLLDPQAWGRGNRVRACLIQCSVPCGMTHQHGVL